jgi:hypothetical protein
MRDRKVVVQGGGRNLYRISEYNGKYTAYKVDAGIFFNSTNKIGTTRSLEDALSLIRAHSGREIDEVS